MDYQLYDQLQAQLGAVGDNYRSKVQALAQSLNTTPENKAVLAAILQETENSLNDLASYISQSLAAASK